MTKKRIVRNLQDVLAPVTGYCLICGEPAVQSLFGFTYCKKHKQNPKTFDPEEHEMDVINRFREVFGGKKPRTKRDQSE